MSERINRDALTAIQQRYDSTIDQVRRLEQEVARQTGQVAALEKALSETYLAKSAKSKKRPPAPDKATAKRAGRKKATAGQRTSE